MACREVTRRRAGNFYWGLRLTPEPWRSAMFAIYAWMRAADDLVDGKECSNSTDLAPGVVAAIEAFRRATRDAVAGNASTEVPLWRALAAVAREYPLDIRDFDEMLDGQLSDLTPRSLQSWAEVDRYCHQVASTVGCACIRIFGFSDPSAIALAEARGVAFQLTNIVRDIREDYARGRVYLPEEELRREGLSAAELCRWQRPEQCAALIERVIARAREQFEISAPLDSMVDRECRPTLWALTRIYRELLERIARDPSQIARGRISLPIHRKLLIALRARSRGAQA